MKYYILITILFLGILLNAQKTFISDTPTEHFIGELSRAFELPNGNFCVTTWENTPDIENERIRNIYLLNECGEYITHIHFLNIDTYTAHENISEINGNILLTGIAQSTNYHQEYLLLDPNNLDIINQNQYLRKIEYTIETVKRNNEYYQYGYGIGDVALTIINENLKRRTSISRTFYDENLVLTGYLSSTSNHIYCVANYGSLGNSIYVLDNELNKVYEIGEVNDSVRTRIGSAIFINDSTVLFGLDYYVNDLHSKRVIQKYKNLNLVSEREIGLDEDFPEDNHYKIENNKIISFSQDGIKYTYDLDGHLESTSLILSNQIENAYSISGTSDGGLVISQDYWENMQGSWTSYIRLIKLNSEYEFNSTDCLLDDIQNVNNEIHLNIYPNPTTSSFTINTSKPVNQIEIRDIKGTLLYTKNYNNSNLDIYPIQIEQRGMMIINVFFEDGINIARKIIIQ